MYEDMYERMLNKEVTLSFDEMISYCGEAGKLWMELDGYLKDKLEMEGCIRFSYVDKYGWSVKYSLKDNHICDVFAENGAFMVLIRISNDEIELIYNTLSDYSKSMLGNKYPYGSGGWVNYHVTSNKPLKDLIKIIETKANKK